MDEGPQQEARDAKRALVDPGSDTGFKAWLGEWEVEPAQASKVEDTNRELMVADHKTDKKLTKFKDKKGSGFWFTPDEESALGYARKNASQAKKQNFYCVFINIKKSLKSQWVSPSNPDTTAFDDDIVKFNVPIPQKIYLVITMFIDRRIL